MAKRIKAAPSGRRKASARRRRSNLSKRTFPGLPVPRSRAIWLDGPVPKGYWNRLKNRRLYMRWLGRKLRIRKPEDGPGVFTIPGLAKIKVVRPCDTRQRQASCRRHPRIGCAGLNRCPVG